MVDNVNVIFIVVDTLRKDYSALLEEALQMFGFVSYKNTITPSPWTLPAHASIFTGVYPALHGVHETANTKNPNIRFKNTLNTLYSQLRDIGYTTYLLSANPYISPIFGFEGFDYFYDMYTGKYSMFLSEREQEELDLLKSKYSHPWEIARGLFSEGMYFTLFKALLSVAVWKSRIVRSSWPFDMGAGRTVKLLKRLPLEEQQPFFLFINLMEVHEPYDRGENPDRLLKTLKNNLTRGYIDWEQVARWRFKYLEEVKYVSIKISEMLNILRNKGVLDKSLVIITSDHGQLLGEYGRLGHGVFLYDELLKVPLLIRYPKSIDFLVSKKGDNKDIMYVNLVNLKRFILDFVRGNIENDSSLFSKVVFSESYGIQDKIANIGTKEEQNNISYLEKYRIAIYYQGLKGIFNVSDWSFETISVDTPGRITVDDGMIHLKKYIVKFLKSIATLKNKTL